MSIFLIGWLPNFGQPASKDTCTVFKHSSSLFICIFFSGEYAAHTGLRLSINHTAVMPINFSLTDYYGV
jgi:hypothetical protein